MVIRGNLTASFLLTTHLKSVYLRYRILWSVQTSLSISLWPLSLIIYFCSHQSLKTPKTMCVWKSLQLLKYSNCGLFVKWVGLSHRDHTTITEQQFPTMINFQNGSSVTMYCAMTKSCKAEGQWYRRDKTVMFFWYHRLMDLVLQLSFKNSWFYRTSVQPDSSATHGLPLFRKAALWFACVQL